MLRLPLGPSRLYFLKTITILPWLLFVVRVADAFWVVCSWTVIGGRGIVSAPYKRLGAVHRMMDYHDYYSLQPG